MFSNYRHTMLDLRVSAKGCIAANVNIVCQKLHLGIVFFSFTKFSLTEFPRLRLVLLFILARCTELWEYLTLRVHIISFYAGFL